VLRHSLDTIIINTTRQHQGIYLDLLNTTMKFVCLAFLVRFAVVDFGVEAFVGSARVLPSVIGNSRPPSTTFFRHHMGDLELDVFSEEAVGDNHNDIYGDSAVIVSREAAMKFFATLFVGLALAQGIFQPRPAFAAENNPSWFARDAPTMVLSGAVKDSDIADFSMPSYQEASRAEVNSNLKGDKFLLGEASKNYGKESSSSSPTEAAVKEVKAAPTVDEKALKAANKKASQEAKARQQAAIEAAAKAAASN